MVELVGADTLGGFIAEAGERFGSLPALAIKPGFRTRLVSYRQLHETALRVGRLLQERGIRQGDRVLLWAPNSPEWVAVYFGCHLAGITLVPLDVRSNLDFAAGVVAATQPKLAIVSRFTPGAGEGIQVPTLAIEALEGLLPEKDELLERVEIVPDDLCEIMFTSGTTGRPKGVMLSHRNVISNVRGARAKVPPSPHIRLLSLLPLSHMLEQTCGLLTPLSGGARVVYPTSRQPAMLFRAIAEHQISMLVVVPQAMQLLLNGIEREARRQGKAASLQRLFDLAQHAPFPLRRILFRSVHAKLGGHLDTIISGGAHLDPELIRRWELMGVAVLQGYGATETAPIITADSVGHHKPDGVGQPIPGVDVRIAPDGEVLAHGPNVFQGYWQEPAATAAVLQDGWYHTGDVGELDADGYLHLKGRKKDLIVLSDGMNVYPEDLERELIRELGVADAVVVGLERDGAPVRVHAVLLMREPESAEAAVRGANARLASYQQITGWTVWPHEDFPRTHTLKVKKTEVVDFLRDRDRGTPTPVAAPAPAAAGEGSLQHLIAELASMPAGEVRADQTLGNDLNLDSLTRVELLSTIESELGVYVDEAQVSPATTVAELERLVEAGRQAGRQEAPFVSWPLGLPAAIGRELFIQGLVFPLYHAFWRVRVVGQERLADLNEPVMIASNHNFGAGTIGLEPAAIGMALPRRLRLRVCMAGEEHAVFDPRFKGFMARLCNVFPLSKEGNVRGSLEYIGRLLDLGWSIVIFPEGKLTAGGPMQPFMGGTGLMAVEGHTPVVPVKITVERDSALQGHWWPPRGAFTVELGEPIRFEPGTTYAEATQRIEAAVRALG